MGPIQVTGNRCCCIHCVCVILRTPDGPTGTEHLAEVSLTTKDYHGVLDGLGYPELKG